RPSTPAARRDRYGQPGCFAASAAPAAACREPPALARRHPWIHSQPPAASRSRLPAGCEPPPADSDAVARASIAAGALRPLRAPARSDAADRRRLLPTATDPPPQDDADARLLAADGVRAL